MVIGGASAFTVDFQGDGLLRYAITTPTVTATSGKTGASNSGTISAGRVVMTARAAADVQDAVVNNTGMISASSVRVQDGEVILDGGDGDVAVGGTVTATGTASGTTGGDVTVTGRNITVADGTKIDASGDAGGGTVKIGGDPHGAGPTPDAANTTVGTASIKADATHTGKGGTVVVWSNGTTNFAGTVSAKGGSGDGGLVETSGHTLHIAPAASVDTRAPKGATGNWLLDPDEIIVAADCTDCDPSATLVTPATITGSLATTDVTLQATGGLQVIDPVLYSSSHALSLLAGGEIDILASVQNALASGGGAINVIAGWNGTTLPPAALTAGGVYGKNGGSVYVGDAADTAVAIGAASGVTTIAGDDVNLGNDDFYSQIGFHGAGGGAIVVRATDTVSLWAGSAGTAYSMIGNGSRNGDVTGSVAGNIDIVTGDLDLSTAQGTAASNWIGNFAAGVESGNVSLIAGQVTNAAAFGASGSLGAMLLADLGTSAQAGSGGDVVLGITNAQTDFINTYLGVGAIDYSSPHALTLLSTNDITLPYSIQNDGMGDLTVLAGWNPSVAPANVLTTPGAYGNLVTEINPNNGQQLTTNANVWVVGAPGISLADTNPGSSFGFSVGASGTGTAIGSKGGTTTVGAGQIYIEGLTGYAQIGYHADGGTGAIHVIANGVPGTHGFTGINACFDAAANICVIGGRDGFSGSNPTYAQIGDLGLGIAGTASSAINVSATGNIAIAGGGIYDSDEGYDPSIVNAYGQIGNGDASRTAVQTVSGAITVQAGGQMNFASSAGAGSPAWLGNRTGAGGSQSGDVTVLAGSLNASASPEAMFVEDLGTSASSGGNLVIGLSGTGENGLAAGDYNSPHAFTYLAGGDVYVVGSIKNDGTGAITLVAGWDGHTLGPAVLTQAGAYGNNGATLTIGGDYANGNVNVGSAGGTTTVLGGDIDIAAVWGNAQLGYHGAGTGDITVKATGDIALTGGDPDADGYAAMIGNGKLNGANFTGSTGGNILLSAGGTISLQTATEECEECTDPVTIYIGNVGGTGGQASGSLTMLAADFEDDGDANGGFGNILAANLVHGDLTIGETDSSKPIELPGGGVYNSSYALTIMSGGGININGEFENAGSGATTLVAGWNGIYDPARIGAAGTFGLGNGTVTIEGNAGIGTAAGDLKIYAGTLDINAGNGPAQLGYHGAGGGNIYVTATHDIVGYGGTSAGDTALLGNGSMAGDVSGNITGNITLSAGGSTAFLDGTSPSGTTAGLAWLGNVAGAGFTEVGNVTATTVYGYFRGDFTTADLGSAPGTGGNVFFGFTDPSVSPLTIGGINYNSPNSYTFAGAGSTEVIGSVTNSGTGAITLVAGWDGKTVGSAADLKAAHAYGLNNGLIILGSADQYQNISLGTAGGLTSVLTNDLTVAPHSGFSAQLGYHGTGGGDISVVASGNLTVTGGINASDVAMIGNGSLGGDVGGAITGNIDISVGGTTNLSTAGDAGSLWIGNAAAAAAGASATGTLKLVTFDLGTTDGLTASLAGDLAGGDATLAITDSTAANTLTGAIAYNSGHALNLLSAGDLTLGGQIQNAGSGAIDVVAGWNGTTFDAAHFGDAGVYGNNGGDVLIGGGAGNAAVGSAGGATSLFAHDVQLSGVNGAAQLGYAGGSTGTVDVAALGTVTLSGGTDLAHFAEIGSGATFGSNAGAGDVTVSGGSIAAGGIASVVANSLSLVANAGSIGSPSAALQFAANALSLRTAGGAAILTTPRGVSIASANLSGGALALTAGGAVTQTGAILSGSLNIATTSGAIVLTDTDNAFGALTVSTQGSDGASFAQGGSLTVAGATVGGTLTLSAGTDIGQTGAIQAAGLTATAANGTVVLTNAGNAFAALALASKAGATVADSSAVTLAASTIGGTLTLSAGGAVGQGGALQSAGLNVSTTSGAIALTSTANAVSGLVQFATPGAATFYDTLGMSVGASAVGGDLTLLSKGDVAFAGSVQSAGGAITVVAGWDGATTDATQFGASGVYGNGGGSVTVGGTGATGDVAVGSRSGATSVYAANVNIVGANGAAQLGYHGAGGGSIKVAALQNVTVTAGAGGALLGNGSLGSDVGGNVTGDIDVRLGGAIAFNDSPAGQAWLGNVAHAGSETGNLILIASDVDSAADDRLGDILTGALGGGDVTAGFTGTGDVGPDRNYSYNSGHTFNLLAAGNLVFAGGIQNAGTGAINLVAGWDGHTLAPTAFGQSGVYGNNAKGVTIGGSAAKGGVAIGSAGGTVSVYGASLTLAAAGGYAQLGFNGHGAGAIAVTTTGGVALTGGGSAGFFAQIGNGGLKTSGNNSGDIAIAAGGNVVLTAGAGAEAYVQIGHGGAESNTGANGYSNTGAIGLTAANLTLSAGSGPAAYAQIGQGGFKSGVNLAGGQAVNSGNITAIVAHQVTLTGNGADGYAQIGNGGSQSNLNAAGVGRRHRFRRRHRGGAQRPQRRDPADRRRRPQRLQPDRQWRLRGQFRPHLHDRELHHHRQHLRDRSGAGRRRHQRLRADRQWRRLAQCGRQRQRQYRHRRERQHHLHAGHRAAFVGHDRQLHRQRHGQRHAHRRPAAVGGHQQSRHDRRARIGRDQQQAERQQSDHDDQHRRGDGLRAERRRLLGRGPYRDQPAVGARPPGVARQQEFRRVEHLGQRDGGDRRLARRHQEGERDAVHPGRHAEPDQSDQRRAHRPRDTAGGPGLLKLGQRGPMAMTRQRSTLLLACALVLGVAAYAQAPAGGSAELNQYVESARLYSGADNYAGAGRRLSPCPRPADRAIRRQFAGRRRDAGGARPAGLQPGPLRGGRRLVPPRPRRSSKARRAPRCGRASRPTRRSTPPISANTKTR